jgi:hypothetical protein
VIAVLAERLHAGTTASAMPRRWSGTNHRHTEAAKMQDKIDIEPNDKCPDGAAHWQEKRPYLASPKRLCLILKM